MLISLPLLSSAAVAGPEATPQVEFGGGGLGLLLCGSKPNLETISVPAQSKVIFVNNLGQNAMLQIDGESGGGVGNGEAVEVQFHRGPVAVAMVPECLLNLTGDFKPVTVQVTAQRTATATTTRVSSPRPPAAASTTGTPTNSPKPKKSRQTGATAPSAGDPTAQRDQRDQRDPSEPTLNDDILTIDPDENESPKSQATTIGPIKNLDGTDARAISGATRDKGPIGLLAIIATVCVVGVSAGAIRAIISQRASRAEFA